MLSVWFAWNMLTRNLFTMIIRDAAFLYLRFKENGVVSGYAFNFLIMFFVRFYGWAALMWLSSFSHSSQAPPGLLGYGTIYVYSLMSDLVQITISPRKGKCLKYLNENSTEQEAFLKSPLWKPPGCEQQPQYSMPDRTCLRDSL